MGNESFPDPSPPTPSPECVWWHSMLVWWIRFSGNTTPSEEQEWCKQTPSFQKSSQEPHLANDKRELSRRGHDCCFRNIPSHKYTDHSLSQCSLYHERPWNNRMCNTYLAGIHIRTALCLNFLYVSFLGLAVRAIMYFLASFLEGRPHPFHFRQLKLQKSNQTKKQNKTPNTVKRE